MDVVVKRLLFHSLLPGGRVEYRYSVGYLWFRIFGSHVLVLV